MLDDYSKQVLSDFIKDAHIKTEVLKYTIDKNDKSSEITLKFSLDKDNKMKTIGDLKQLYDLINNGINWYDF